MFFFFNDTATTEIYTRSIVGSVRCVQETGVHGGMKMRQLSSQSVIFNTVKSSFSETMPMKDGDTFMQVSPKNFPNSVCCFGCHKMDLHIFDTNKKQWTLTSYKDWFKF
eukprot:TRINITY_DN4774_c0_g1_i3.p3 TRINITY_DN4774_c0_g1~~TRINITY_DN4774_c0_g1_i3.p3  ORF type:complete len:109 (-),score=28.00 TRINITY_DN4774_c0_g1_i3:154-480(-)